MYKSQKNPLTLSTSDDNHPLQWQVPNKDSMTHKKMSDRKPVIDFSSSINDPLLNIKTEETDKLEVQLDESKEDAFEHENDWHRIEESTLKSNESSEEKVEVPEALQYLLPILDSSQSAPPVGNSVARLEWLENRLREDLIQKRNGHIDESEITGFFDSCNNKLCTLWKDDHRVQVVKMVVQLSKMLSPDSISRLYPKLFFLITDCLTHFGKLVYERILHRCPPLQMNFTFDDVSDQAKELCKNWLHKIASSES